MSEASAIAQTERPATVRTLVADLHDLELDEGDFADMGEAFAATGQERSSITGAGRGRLCSMRAIVDFATDWMNTHRT